MLDDLVHNIELRRLQKKKKRSGEENDKLIAAARKEGKEGKDREEIDHLMWEGHTDQLYFDDTILALQSRHLTRKAEKYLLPRPPFDREIGDWEESEVTRRWRLTLPAQASLRTAIHNYEKERRERVQSWLIALTGIIGAATGLIGVLIGLISIWPNSN